MPPFKALPKSEAAAKKEGFAPMTTFFGPKPLPGRPKKKPSNAGRRAVHKDSAPAAAAATAATEAPTQKPKVKATRQSWSKGEGLKRMSDALATWEEEQAKPEKDRTSLRLLAEKEKIPYATLQQHLTGNAGKRVKLGDGVGPKPLLSSKSQEVIVDVLVRKDRANEGVGVGGALDIIEEMHPELKRTQIDQAFRRTVRPAFVHRLTNPVATQATTTKRTAITVQQQWRWHQARSTDPPSSPARLLC